MVGLSTDGAGTVNVLERFRSPKVPPSGNATLGTATEGSLTVGVGMKSALDGASVPCMPGFSSQPQAAARIAAAKIAANFFIAQPSFAATPPGLHAFPAAVLIFLAAAAGAGIVPANLGQVAPDRLDLLRGRRLPLLVHVLGQMIIAAELLMHQ